MSARVWCPACLMYAPPHEHAGLDALSGSGSEPPANPPWKVQRYTCGCVSEARLTHCDRHAQPPGKPGDWEQAVGAAPWLAPESGSPPVGPLQALREALTTERFLPIAKNRAGTDAALVSVEEQLAALQRSAKEAQECPRCQGTAINEGWEVTVYGDQVSSSCACGTGSVDGLVKALEAQVAALQRERDDLKAENARMRPWYPKTEVGGGSSPSYPKGDPVPSAPQTQEET